ncbi:unnamed protein product [Heterobilharzia americana]|nr:unnamed protein product [Heterobilharzia americana]
MDERDVQDDDYDENDANSHSSDDDSIEENIFIGSGITNPLVGNRVIAEHDNNLSPSGRESKSSTHVTSQNYATVSHGSTDRKSKRRIHSNNLCRSTSDKYSKIADLSTSTASYSNRMSSPIQTLPVMTTSMMSSSGVTTDQTVSVEQYRALYARCLRVESYRRALSFQKRYLLLLLGNFQYSEDVVVANLGCPESRIAPQVDSEDGFPSRLNSSPLQRFRIIGRVVQVVHRMRYLVNKWRRVGVISIPSMQSTPFSYTESHANTVPPNSYYVPPFQHRSFNFQSARAITTNRNPNSSLRTPLRELHTDESNNTSLSVVKNSSNFNGKPLLLNNSNYIPRVSQVQTSPSCYNSLREDQTVSKAVSHRWRPYSSFNQSTTMTNSTGIPIARYVPVTPIAISTAACYDRPEIRNHQQSSSSSNLSVENRRRIGASSSTSCRVDSIQTHTVRTVSHNHTKNKINTIHKRSSYS